MVFDFEPRIETNIKYNTQKVYQYENLYLKKGDLIGYFKMGSTVLVFWEKDMVELKNLVDEKVRFSQTIATFNI
jgi:phosphatidylserine decarboxylase